MRELITHPSVEEFTQGSIFEGLKVSSDHPSTSAIVITARCDIANGKARNILCLPIYKASEWLKNQGEELIFRRLEEKLRNKLGVELNKFQISVDILDTYPVKNILKIIQDNSNQKCTLEINKLLDMYAYKKCDYSLKFVSDEKKNLCTTLIKNTENSIYFIEQIDLDEVLEPYIIDLTDPISIPYPIALKLKSGISKKNTDKVTEQYLDIKEREISYVSVLNSPYIEHLLQKFVVVQ
ncbi:MULTISPECIES: hypothetical protein [unclassified Pseudoalteromonas]|uniref:hypothetical protein n=1 Tax=unclassified Pseudoalteromonas TaxID=194690 RepID=UPI000C349DC7|nr:hypothetical protein [Pseudoalteromonas sp. 78C3]PKH92936.1 hypothetical protein CXF76_03925 [Pseudoalteromonas sp. 78C3]